MSVLALIIFAASADGAAPPPEPENVFALLEDGSFELLEDDSNALMEG